MIQQGNLSIIMYNLINAPSPNFTNTKISVDFIVVHYTATSLARTLEIFADPSRKVSAHIVIDRNGDVYEVVQCLSGPALRAWHAGVSRLSSQGSENSTVILEGFNDFSIGIELVNVNGNVFPYTDFQYNALIEVLLKLCAEYPNVKKISQIVGHEEIAGFRGKCDPGVLFDWERVQKGAFPEHGPLEGSSNSRKALCTEALSKSLGRLYADLGVSVDPMTGEFIGIEGNRRVLEGVSALLEAAVEAGARSSY